MMNATIHTSTSPYRSLLGQLLRKQPLTRAEELEVLRRIRVLATMLDSQLGIPGTNYRIGWDGIIGLIPVVGDIATGLLATYIVFLAHQLNVPRTILARMLVNVAIDVSAGSIPIVGDLADMAWKANLKNVRLLEQHLQRKHAQRIVD